MNDQADIEHMAGVQAELVLILALVAAEAAGTEADPALINAVGRGTATVLQQQGYTLRPVSTQSEEREKGGFIVEVVTMITQLAATTWDHRAAVEEVIADLSGLISILTAIIPVFKQVFHAHERQVGKQESLNHPITIALEIDGAPLLITAPDVEQAEAALKLASRFHSTHPTIAQQVTVRSKVKAQGRVPARKRRPRR